MAAKRCLGLGDADALDPFVAAREAGIVLFKAEFFERFTAAERHHVLDGGASQWSAGTIIAGGLVAIVLNPSHDLVRQRATLAEELAHIVIGHPPSLIDTETGMRTYDAEVENEAYGVGGAMLMPYGQLFALCKRGMPVPEIAHRYGLSVAFTNYRINRTGLRRMYANRARLAGRTG
jgi:hypothetical protein